MTTATLDRTLVSNPPKGALKKRLKRLAPIGLGLLIATGAAWYGYDWWSTGRFIESTDDAYVGGDVTVIAPKVSGLIAQVAVTDNQTVHAGDLLVKLDGRDYQAALAKAEAAVAAQQAALVNLDATRRLQEAVIAQCQADIVAAAAEIVRAHDDQSRYQKLLATSDASTQRFQQADATYKSAVAYGQKMRAALDAAQRQVDVIDSQKQQANAALAQAMAERDLAQLDVGYTELRAPIDGVIGNRAARDGAYATVGARLLAVVPARGLWVDANFKESQLSRMQPGLEATIKADVLPGREFHGHVVSLAPATGATFSVLPPENATGNFTKIVQRVPVRILLDGEASDLGLLRPGLSVTVSVDLRPANGGGK
jgi:membrane fusion protein (multidrug efflux system)